jgi:hypothetical protein
VAFHRGIVLYGNSLDDQDDLPDLLFAIIAQQHIPCHVFRDYGTEYGFHGGQLAPGTPPMHTT